MNRKPVKIKLVTFSSDEKFRLNQIFMNASALSFTEISSVSSWNNTKLRRTKFYEKHRQILNQKRGRGYWLWKPYIITEELSCLDDNDYLIYCDCGRLPAQLFSRSLKPLLKICDENQGRFPGVYIPQHGSSKKWTKRDCFVLMGADNPRYWNSCQIQASFSIWKKNKDSIEFLNYWLTHCTDARIITDQKNVCRQPNFPEFIDHRHDQSILTIAAIKFNIPGLGDQNDNKPFSSYAKNIDNVLEQLGQEKQVNIYWHVLNILHKGLWLGLHKSRLIRKLIKATLA